MTSLNGTECLIKNRPRIELPFSKFSSNVPLYLARELGERLPIAIFRWMIRTLFRARLVPMSVVGMVNDTFTVTIHIKLNQSRTFDHVTEGTARNFQFHASNNR